ncbi:MAG TPA: trypsin-like peptidase domain-containing protein [Thermoanaerobaculia bacterium]|nr:trypsin-like peptidase domain-containing protein [Thermoanaerobaculia bacterium]
MPSRSQLTLVAIVLATLAGLAAASPLAAERPAVPSFEDLFVVAPQMAPETVGTPRDPAARNAAMRALQEKLAAERVGQALRRPVVVELSSAELDRIDRAGIIERRYLVGVARPVGTSVDFSAARALDKGTVGLNLGAARATGGAGFVWTAAVQVPGATAIRLHLTGVDLPAGAKLYAYNLAGQAFGPYTGRGIYGDGVVHTHTVFGDRMLLQLHAPAGAERAPRLTLAEIGAMGARFAAPRYGPRGAFTVESLSAVTEAASNLCPINVDCVVNAACTSSSAVNAAKDAVASILFQSGGSFFICSGGLVADTVTSSVIPYFLTANHCIGSSTEAASVETYFDYATTCNSPNCTQPYNNTGETVGSTIKSTNSTSDYSLLQLSSAPTTPDGVATYLGWQTTAVANTNGTPLFRISHPRGSPQAYSEHQVDTSKTTCRTWPRGNWIYSADTLGATEGGSSGSPVVNSAGQIVGQLSGACGFNVNDSCDAAANATVDGAFAAYFNAVAPFLSPGGGSCSPKGASCTTASQCCSNNCKGPTGGKTCK